MMYQGYFDESGDLESEPRIFCISGYFLTSKNAAEMDDRWGRVLDDYGLPYFHMVDCAHGSGIFKALAKDDRISLVRRLIKLIKQYTLRGFSEVFYAGRFDSTENEPDAYSSGVSTAVTALKVFVEASGMDPRNVAYFFETGHDNKGRAYNHVASRIQKTGASITFAEKKKVRLLQAADLLAWQTSKFLKDRLGQKRAPRKDFLSLMEHRHVIFHNSRNELGEQGSAIEEFPTPVGNLSVKLTLENDGPIGFLREADRSTPIVPVTKVLGWRRGADGNAVVGFKQMDSEKEVAISMDSPRLFEAIVALVNATANFPNEKVQAGFAPADIIVQKRETGVFLTCAMHC